ncbi:hypothetical protein NDU88_002350 [Pleurodeles waltl]|uniref:Uncharacterized protein n=1 Tax=Pleurodeles waltl TaxID=8319 RepID=A0AAV7WQE7_PLEWA|nr:hypothetical protein NDU88_002350 [Pleurodeles waltl]
MAPDPSTMQVTTFAINTPSRDGGHPRFLTRSPLLRQYVRQLLMALGNSVSASPLFSGASRLQPLESCFLLDNTTKYSAVCGLGRRFRAESRHSGSQPSCTADADGCHPGTSFHFRWIAALPQGMTGARVALING